MQNICLKNMQNICLKKVSNVCLKKVSDTMTSIFSNVCLIKYVGLYLSFVIFLQLSKT